MASINDKEVINQITGNKGVYEVGGEADPAVTHIIQYGNIFNGGVTYSLAYSEAEFRHQWETGVWVWSKVYWTLADGFNVLQSGGDQYSSTSSEDCLFDAEERALDICDCGIAGGCK